MFIIIPEWSPIKNVYPFPLLILKSTPGDHSRGIVYLFFFIAMWLWSLNPEGKVTHCHTWKTPGWGLELHAFLLGSETQPTPSGTLGTPSDRLIWGSSEGNGLLFFMGNKRTTRWNNFWMSMSYNTKVIFFLILFVFLFTWHVFSFRNPCNHICVLGYMSSNMYILHNINTHHQYVGKYGFIGIIP